MGYLPFTTSHARAGCGKSTHAHAHRHTRTHKALCNLCRHSAEPQTALAQPEKAQLKLARRPPWAAGWGCSERGLCPSLALFQAALSLFFSPLTPSTLTPSSHPSPSTPSPPTTQRHRSCYWGSLERGAIPSSERLQRLPGARLELQLQDPSARPEQRRNETPTSRHGRTSLPQKKELLGLLPFL